MSVATAARTPGGREQPRPSSPNYFGLTVDSGSDPRESGARPNGNWSPPTSSIRSFNASTPKHIPVEANPDFEAFRRQSERNHSFTLSHGNLSHFASTPSAAGGSQGSQDYMSAKVDGNVPRPQAESAHHETPSFFDMPQQQSPMAMPQTQMPPVAAKHFGLSFPGNRPSPPLSKLQSTHAPVRSGTLPTVLEDGPSIISPKELRDLLKKIPESKRLLLDLRVTPQYAQSRIEGALSLCIPTTLLKRPSFNLSKLTDTFKVPDEHAKFCTWKECEYIILYDTHSNTLKDATSAMHTIKKFTNEGWEGKAVILAGGFQAFAQQEEFVNRKPIKGTNSSGPGQLSLGSLAPDVAPVAGGCEMPKSKGAANPFFSNIRQNMDLVGGVGQMDVKRPDNPDMRGDEFLPPWLSKAAAIEDHGKGVSDKFLHIEQAELSRMQNALSSTVTYGSSSAGGDKNIQIAGFEKGSKNRYNNIWPFEHARVRLQGRGEGACDYVNASHIKAPWSNKRYIASQGPLPSTFEDFWSVVWDQDVRVIVMLTAESEGGQLKCHPYWAAQSYGQFRVRALSEKKVSLDPHRHRRSSARGDEFPTQRKMEGPQTDSSKDLKGDYPYVVVRKMALTDSAQPFAPMREITQLHYSSWPDFGAPAQPSHLLGLVELSNRVQRGSLPTGIASQTTSDDPEPANVSRPMLVHCSAGCGRTGTFCTVDSVIDMLKRQRKEYNAGVTPMDLSNKEPDYTANKSSPSDMDNSWVFNPNIDLIEHTVADFRKQRLSMVQSLRQYVLCYETVLEWVSQHHEGGKQARSRSLSYSSVEY